MRGGGIRILFAGGGTGGHVFPGLALAELAPGPVSWLSTSRPFDLRELSRARIPFWPLESPRWQGFRGFLGPLAHSTLAAARHIRAFQPDVLIGVGGYGTLPPVIAAGAHGVPYVLLEPNVRPGKANRFLAPGAARIYTHWEETALAFPGCARKVRRTGSPLRSGLERIPRGRARERFGLAPDRPTVAIVGGSQGAEALNRGALAGLNGAASRVQVIHVSGAAQVDRVRRAYEERGARAAVLDFVTDMGALYSAADLVVSRAGALAIAELAAFEVPSVLVPIARSPGDHQRENARAVARSGGALLLEEKDCEEGALGPILEKLAVGDPVFDRMKQRLGPFARPRAAEAILRDLGELFGP